MSIFSSLFPFLHDPPARMALRIFRQSPEYYMDLMREKPGVAVRFLSQPLNCIAS
jgi:hypothetical protein